MNISKRLKELMAQRGWSGYKLASEAVLTQSTVSNLLVKNTSPTVETLEHICEGFGITLAEFFTEEKENTDSTDDCSKLTSSELAHIRNYRKLSEEKKKVVDQLVEMLK